MKKTEDLENEGLLVRRIQNGTVMQRLRAKGVRIARRTVAKYRDQLGILSARMRKRV